MKTKPQHFYRKKSAPILLFLFIAAVALSTGIGIDIFLKSQTPIAPQAEDYISTSSTVDKNKDSISIPGYEGLTLQANSLQQNISLKNPSQNTCYFVISLCLEDGTVLWESDYIQPGCNSTPIKLTKELQAGTYPNAVLKYSCFKMNQEKTPLNGAKTKLTLRVK